MTIVGAIDPGKGVCRKAVRDRGSNTNNDNDASVRADGIARVARAAELGMLKKIPVGRVTIGMFFVRPDGSWLDHGLWIGKFMIRDAQQLASVRECGVSHVWIDTDKGRDVDEEAAITAAPTASCRANARNAATR